MDLNQKELFYKWKEAGHSVIDLGSFVQNDLSDMLQDNNLTKDDIKKALSEFSEAYRKVLNTLYSLKCDTEAILKKYSA
jgi:hypothetical protein